MPKTVAPRMGAWIEIYRNVTVSWKQKSLPAWGGVASNETRTWIGKKYIPVY